MKEYEGGGREDKIRRGGVGIYSLYSRTDKANDIYRNVSRDCTVAV